MLYEYVRSAMGLLETGEEKLSQTRELQMGQLTIGAQRHRDQPVPAPYLDTFHKRHPAIHIQIVSGRSHKVLGLLRSGKVDIAFASTPADDAGLRIYPCFDTHAIFVAGAEYPCDFRHVYTLEEIAGVPADPAGAQGLQPFVSGTVLFAEWAEAEPGDRAGRPEPAGGSGGHRLRCGRAVTESLSGRSWTADG